MGTVVCPIGAVLHLDLALDHVLAIFDVTGRVSSGSWTSGDGRGTAGRQGLSRLRFCRVGGSGGSDGPLEVLGPN